jgi:beta-phosphoglucomutase-like phosphatase (HAD superfamily)
MATGRGGVSGAGGGQPSTQQIQAMQQQLAAEAARHNMSVEQYINHLKAHAMKQAQAQQEQREAAAAQKQQEQEEYHVNTTQPVAVNPQAVALAKWLRAQELKTRTCILSGQRKDMFKGKLCTYNSSALFSSLISGGFFCFSSILGTTFFRPFIFPLAF